MLFSLFVIFAFESHCQCANSGAETAKDCLDLTNCQARCDTFCSAHPLHLACQPCDDATYQLACANSLPQCKAKCVQLCTAADNKQDGDCLVCTPESGGAYDECTPGTASMVRCAQECTIGCMSGTLTTGCPSLCSVDDTSPLLPFVVGAECDTERTAYCAEGGAGYQEIQCASCNTTEATTYPQLACSTEKGACMKACDTDCATITTQTYCDVCSPETACTTNLGRCKAMCSVLCLLDEHAAGCDDRIDCYDDPCDKDKNGECDVECAAFCTRLPADDACTACTANAAACTNHFKKCLQPCAEFCGTVPSASDPNCPVCGKTLTAACADYTTNPRCIAVCDAACTDTPCAAGNLPDCMPACEAWCIAPANQDDPACAACTAVGAASCTSPVLRCKTTCDAYCLTAESAADTNCPTCATTLAASCTDANPRCKAVCDAYCLTDASAADPNCPTCKTAAAASCSDVNPRCASVCADHCAVPANAASNECKACDKTDAATCTSPLRLCEIDCKAFCVKPANTANDACAACDKTGADSCTSTKRLCESVCSAWCTDTTNAETEACGGEGAGAFSVVLSFFVLLLALL